MGQIRGRGPEADSSALASSFGRTSLATVISPIELHATAFEGLLVRKFAGVPETRCIRKVSPFLVQLQQRAWARGSH